MRFHGFADRPSSLGRPPTATSMGNYRYSQKIGRGGMAQVYLAIQEGIGGFEKPVVVKRIFPHLCESEHFVKMFLDEARLAATVRHPNVVEIFDIGHDAEGYFMVMEYLSGETVAFVAQALSRKQQAIPPAIACRIGAAVATGLHHAHRAVDATGKPQPLVHRDVTPSNLMLCYNGAIKILDFGIAKAIENADETSDASAVKGKLSYLAPEQVRNRPLDARTDVFQLGIVMHEILCGRRLFNARTNHEKITAVLDREIPKPSSINTDVPIYLDDIVLAALERDPAKRIQSADELRRALEDALRRMGEPVGGTEVGNWLRETFPDAHRERLEVERCAIIAARTSDTVIAGIRNAAEPVALGKSGPISSFATDSQTPSAHGQSVTAPGNPHEPDIDAMLALHAAMAAESDDPDMEQPTVAVPHEQVREVARAHDRRRRLYWIAAALVGGLVASAGILMISSRGNDESRSRAAHSSVQSVPSSDVRDRGDEDNESTPAPPEPTSNPEHIDLSAETARFDFAVVTVPENATIELDGRERSVGSMFGSLPRDEEMHVLVISAPGYARLEIPFSAGKPPPSVVRLSMARPSNPNSSKNEARPVRDRRPPEGEKRVEKAADLSDDAAESQSGDKPAAAPKTTRTDNIDPWAQ